MDLRHILTEEDPRVKREDAQHIEMFHQLEGLALEAKSLRLPNLVHQYDSLFSDSDASRRPSTQSISTTATDGSVSSIMSSPRIAPLQPRTSHSSANRRLDQIAGHVQPYPHANRVRKPTKWAGVGRRDHSPRRLSNRRRTPPKDPRKREKSDREWKARLSHGELLAKLENILLAMNPSFPEEAHGAEGRGWKLLKCNNVRNDIEDPMLHNKNDILSTDIEILEQDVILLHLLIERLKSLGDFEGAQVFAEAMRKRGTRQYEEPAFPLFPKVKL